MPGVFISPLSLSLLYAGIVAFGTHPPVSKMRYCMTAVCSASLIVQMISQFRGLKGLNHIGGQAVARPAECEPRSSKARGLSMGVSGLVEEMRSGVTHFGSVLAQYKPEAQASE